MKKNSKDTTKIPHIFIVFKIILLFLFLVINPAMLWSQNEIIAFQAATYDRFIIYQNLVIFWIAIFGLVIIILMKLKEIKRIKKMGIDREEKNIPTLD